MTKKKKQRILAAKQHFIRRAKERYDLVFKLDQVDQVRSMIKKDKALKIKDITNTRSLYIIRWDGEYLPVVYGKHIKTPLTVLPCHVIDDEIYDMICEYFTYAPIIS